MVRIDFISTEYTPKTYVIDDKTSDRNPIGRHWSGWELVYVMACCLTIPSLYQNLFWLVSSEVPWHSHELSNSLYAHTEDSDGLWKWDFISSAENVINFITHTFEISTYLRSHYITFGIIPSTHALRNTKYKCKQITSTYYILNEILQTVDSRMTLYVNDCMFAGSVCILFSYLIKYNPRMDNYLHPL